MSVIAFQRRADGWCIASDLQRTQNGIRYTYHGKLSRLETIDCSPAIFGIVGDLHKGLEAREWYHTCHPQLVKSEPPKKSYPTFSEDEGHQLIVLTWQPGTPLFPELRVYQGAQPISLTGNTISAWGTGAELALGAMVNGADPIEAVKVACTLQVDCGCGVAWYKATKHGIESRMSRLEFTWVG